MAVGITCERCNRTFKDERALLLHYEHGVKAGSANGSSVSDPEDAHARFIERAQCGNDASLRGKGLVNHAWMAADGLRDNYWTNRPE
jgi:hypothetical protein